jgi:sulfur-oxidizing protein SoxY
MYLSAGDREEWSTPHCQPGLPPAGARGGTRNESHDPRELAARFSRLCVAAEIKKLFGDKAPQEGKIKLDLPTIAENGLVVPLGFEVESPMTEQSYVKAVHFFADENPSPGIASFHFTPMIPKAAGAIRIRLAKTQNIVAVAEMSTGEVYKTQREVKVTIGGCGG